MDVRRGLAAAGALIVVTGCGSTGNDEANRADTFTVRGTLTLKDGDAVNYARRGRAGEKCWGEGGYSDIVEGAQVVIRDGDGTKVAVDELGPGLLTKDSPNRYYAAPCRFVIYVDDVPGGEGVYSVEVGHRGEVSFERGEEVTLALG